MTTRTMKIKMMRAISPPSAMLMRSACAGHRHRRRKRQQRPHESRFRGVSSWTLQLGSLWGSDGGSAVGFSSLDLKY